MSLRPACGEKVAGRPDEGRSRYYAAVFKESQKTPVHVLACTGQAAGSIGSYPAGNGLV